MRSEGCEKLARHLSTNIFLMKLSKEETGSWEETEEVSAECLKFESATPDLVLDRCIPGSPNPSTDPIQTHTHTHWNWHQLLDSLPINMPHPNSPSWLVLGDANQIHTPCSNWHPFPSPHLSHTHTHTHSHTVPREYMGVLGRDRWHLAAGWTLNWL